MHQPILLKNSRVSPREIHTQRLSGKVTAAHPPEHLDVELNHMYPYYHSRPSETFRNSLYYPYIVVVHDMLGLHATI